MGEPTASPLPAVPLAFSRRRVWRTLLLLSLALVVASFAAQLLFSNTADGLGVARSIWLGISAMWLVVLTAVQKRHNLAKTTVYVVLLVSFVCVYWDYLTGWDAWSLTYAVPAVCAAAALGLAIIVRLMRIELGDHIVYSSQTVLFGLAPIAFLALGWVTSPVPSIVCGILSLIVLLPLQLARARMMRHELGKRLHL
ncbi:DUF6320 domain-containing protein [Gulosibacter molinativorax]|uniref:DUF6320 domain-containing protein n=1 Tax=Gulosibacter molinativorax TaxID=256821 RepID=UPI00042897FB|nr:DUF6320 domain-containing protein [Gulosibacter molinativorax]